MERMRPHVVVLSTLFPAPGQPQAGLFVRERMLRVAARLPVTVVSPMPWFPLQGLLARWRPSFRPPAPPREVQAGVEVLRPRFFSLPGVLKRFDGWFLALGALSTLRALKRAGRMHVLDAHFAYPDGYAAARLGRWLGVPVTITLRGSEARQVLEGPLRKRIAGALHAAQRVFAVADALKKVALSLGVEAEKVRVLRNGVDSAKFHPVARAQARRSLGLPEDAPVLISVGGLVERKGFHRVIACLPELSASFPGLQYLVVGGASPEGDMSRELRSQVASLRLQDRVRFLGALRPEELKVPLSAADVFVLATRNEGWANVFLEAMACGLPVITTDVGGNAEVVCRDELGTVVPFDDHAALVEAIAAALRRPWNRDAIVGYARARDWSACVDALTDELTAVAVSALRPEGRPAKGAYTRLVSGVLFPLHERLKGHGSVSARARLEQMQWWPSQQLEALRAARLRALLEHAGSRVPYYAELWRRCGISAGEVRGPQDLSRLPLLAKGDIRANLEALKSLDAGSLARSNTGGSTGEPLIYFLGKERISHDVAARWRATRWWGVDIGDPEIVVWGSPIELGAQDRLRGLRDAVLRTELVPAFDLSDAALEQAVKRIRRRRPKMLFGYPSALAHIARYAQRRGIALDELGIEVAFVTAERLYGDQRAIISRVFGCAVANGYGSREAGFIAHECPAGGMHISAEDVIVEIVDGAGRPLPAGRPGEIVVTHLASREFPFIRYRTGDIGVLAEDPCPCGRTLPLLKDIQGRSTDFVVARNGRVMHGLALIYVIREVPGVRQFKVIQESLEHTRVLLATDADFREGDVQTIRRGIEGRLGEGVTVDIERVAHIAGEASGKYRYVLSRI